MYAAYTYTGGDNVNDREATSANFTLSTKGNVNLTKQLNEGLKRSVYWNEYKSKIETKTADNNNVTRFPLDASFQGVNRFLFLLLTTLKMVIERLKETIMENISYQE